jgi:hypothetical protein
MEEVAKNPANHLGRTSLRLAARRIFTFLWHPPPMLTDSGFKRICANK